MADPIITAKRLAPFTCDGRYIWAEGPKGKFMIAELRGWGYLTGNGHGALGLSDEDARKVRHDWGEMIERALNMQAQGVQIGTEAKSGD